MASSRFPVGWSVVAFPPCPHVRPVGQGLGRLETGRKRRKKRKKERESPSRGAPSPPGSYSPVSVSGGRGRWPGRGRVGAEQAKPFVGVESTESRAGAGGGVGDPPPPTPAPGGAGVAGRAGGRAQHCPQQEGRLPRDGGHPALQGRGGGRFAGESWGRGRDRTQGLSARILGPATGTCPHTPHCWGGRGRIRTLFPPHAQGSRSQPGPPGRSHNPPKPTASPQAVSLGLSLALHSPMPQQ